MKPRRWAVHMTSAADSDLRAILRWTGRNFGARQARIYAETLSLALQALTEGPRAPGVRAMPEVEPALFRLHVARGGRRGRHFILFRVASDEPFVTVLRLLHDSMDTSRHLPAENDR